MNYTYDKQFLFYFYLLIFKDLGSPSEICRLNCILSKCQPLKPSTPLLLLENKALARFFSGNSRQ